MLPFRGLNSALTSLPSGIHIPTSKFYLITLTVGSALLLVMKWTSQRLLFLLLADTAKSNESYGPLVPEKSERSSADQSDQVEDGERRRPVFYGSNLNIIDGVRCLTGYCAYLHTSGTPCVQFLAAQADYTESDKTASPDSIIPLCVLVRWMQQPPD